jgi:hypothetical protein
MLAGCGAISAHAQQSPGPAVATTADTIDLSTQSRDDVTLPERDRKDVPWKSFSELTKGARFQSGVFGLYTKRDNNYLSIAPTQFDRDYLLVTQLSQGIGELGVDGGSSVRALGSQPALCRHSGNADGQGRRLFLRSLGGAVVSNRDHAR